MQSACYDGYSSYACMKPSPWVSTNCPVFIEKLHDCFNQKIYVVLCSVAKPSHVGYLRFKAWGWRDFFPALALFCNMLFVLRS